jgi:hypothetical protein
MTGTAATPPGADHDETRSTEQTIPRHTDGGGRGRHRGLYWLLPVLAFLGGLLLGGSVIAAAGLGSGDEPAASATEPAGAPTPEPSTTAGGSSTSGDRTVTIPASCVEGLDKAETAIQRAREGVDAIGGLDSERLQQSLDRLLTLQREITDLAATCRSAATDGS